MGDTDKKSFVFYETFYTGLKLAPEQHKNELIKIIIEYGLYGTEPQFDGFGNEMKWVLEMAWENIKTSIDASKARHERNVANGKKGGRGKSNEKPTEKPKKAKSNLNVNANDNPNRVVAEPKTSQPTMPSKSVGLNISAEEREKRAKAILS